MAHSKLYVRLMNSREWSELRKRKLHENPLCEICASRSVVRSAEVVHHRVEVESGRSEEECIRLAFAYLNLQSLCLRCHKEVHTGSHTKKAHAKRQEERLEQFKSHVTGELSTLEELFCYSQEKPSGDES